MGGKQGGKQGKPLPGNRTSTSPPSRRARAGASLAAHPQVNPAIIGPDQAAMYGEEEVRVES